MSAEQAKGLSRSREAWAALGDEFVDIGRRFREDYEKEKAGSRPAAG